MFRALMRTRNEFSTMILRLGLGVVMLAHGAGKVIEGIYDEIGMTGVPAEMQQGLEKTVEHMTASYGLEPWQVYCAIAAEALGGLALIFGLFGRVAALGIAATMGTAAYLAHWNNGLFINWMGKEGLDHGIEFHILAVAMAVALMWRGSGALSIDRALSARSGGSTTSDDDDFETVTTRRKRWKGFPTQGRERA